MSLVRTGTPATKLARFRDEAMASPSLGHSAYWLACMAMNDYPGASPDHKWADYREDDKIDGRSCVLCGRKEYNHGTEDQGSDVPASDLGRHV